MNRKIGYFFAAICLIIGSCFAPHEYSDTIFAMDTIINIKAYGTGCEEAVKAASDEIMELESELSVTDDKSDIGRINSSGGIAVTVSDDTADVITGAIEYCKITGGALDISVYPVLLKWGFTTGEYRIPTNDEISDALALTDYTKMNISGNEVTLPAGMMIDLGACAKGYAGDKLISVMSGKGISSALVNIGGNVAALGAKPDGPPWTVGIADPRSPDDLIGKISISGGSVVTSGGYQRYFTGSDGKIYSHIIDPSDGKPAESGISSVTVTGENGLMCDALSTAFYVMGQEKASEYYRRNGGFGMIIVGTNEKIYVTENISPFFENTSDMPTEIIHG